MYIFVYLFISISIFICNSIVLSIIKKSIHKCLNLKQLDYFTFCYRDFDWVLYEQLNLHIFELRVWNLCTFLRDLFEKSIVEFKSSEFQFHLKESQCKS